MQAMDAPLPDDPPASSADVPSHTAPSGMYCAVTWPLLRLVSSVSVGTVLQAACILVLFPNCGFQYHRVVLQGLIQQQLLVTCYWYNTLQMTIPHASIQTTYQYTMRR